MSTIKTRPGNRCKITLPDGGFVYHSVHLLPSGCFNPNSRLSSKIVREETSALEDEVPSEVDVESVAAVGGTVSTSAIVKKGSL
jgi:hypothetical protein